MTRPKNSQQTIRETVIRSNRGGTRTATKMNAKQREKKVLQLQQEVLKMFLEMLETFQRNRTRLEILYVIFVNSKLARLKLLLESLPLGDFLVVTSLCSCSRGGWSLGKMNQRPIKLCKVNNTKRRERQHLALRENRPTQRYVPPGKLKMSRKTSVALRARRSFGQIPGKCRRRYAYLIRF